MLVTAYAIPALADDPVYENYAKIRFVENKNGLVLGYSMESGVGILYDVDSGYYFKDLNKNGKIDKYEDWRLDIMAQAAGKSDCFCIL